MTAPAASLTLTRDALPGSLDDLVITANPGDEDFWIDESGFGRPQFAWRKTHAPESEVFPGQSLLSAVMDQSAIPCAIYAHADTSAELDALQTELEEALGQFVFTVTQTIDGVAKSYTAECNAPVWGNVDSGEVRAHLVRAVVVIPVNPPGA